MLGLTLVAVAAAPPVAEQAPPQVKEKEKANEKAVETTVPFELLASNHMVVKARVNGAGPYRLVFDLGAPVTLLSTRAATAAGIMKKGERRSLLFGAKGAENLEALKVGDLTAKDLSVVVLDHPALKVLGGALGRPLDGIVGFTFFARYKTTIDYQAREMSFEPVEYVQSDLMKDMAARLAGPKVAKRRVLAPLSLFGLSVGAVDDADDAGRGVRVVAVAAGSPAEAAGLQAGDLLTALDGRWTTSVADAYLAAATLAPGRPVEAKIVRDQAERTLTVTPKDGF